ncbi:hypothetical protein [Alkanindiges illinoisensis]|uniref:hypothetical protein n=1 Tax=Alkanindiges illinoisensis TaxID=197183 RepID=UPI00047B5D28|nr:hypothetical protein [Alkanindiges illinoisensis]
MRWIIYFFALFIIIDVVVIAYWRDSQANTTLSNILVYLLVLPLGIFGISYLVRLIYKKQNNPIKPDPNNHSETPALAEQVEQKTTYLRIHAATLQTSEGEDITEILDALKQYKTAQLDSQLVNASGVHILSRRIDLSEDELEHLSWFNDTDSSASDTLARFKRIAVIVQRLLQNMDLQLCLLSQGMTQAAQWHVRPEFEQPILHPAWNGQRDEHITQHTEQVIHQIQQWPVQVKIHCFLPPSPNTQDYELIRHTIDSLLQQFGFSVDQFLFLPVVLSPALSQQDLLHDLLQQIKQDEKNIHLILGADSLIDQDEVDEIIWEKPDYITAEAGYGLLISNFKINISDYEDSGYILVNPDEKKLTLKTPEKSSLIVSAFNPLIHTHQIKPLLSYLSQLELNSDELLFAGTLLESVSDQASGLALTFSAALTQQLDIENHLFLMNEDQKNYSWFFTKDLDFLETSNE